MDIKSKIDEIIWRHRSGIKEEQRQIIVEEIAKAISFLFPKPNEPLFVILDMKYTKDSKQAAFWRANCSGRTVNPFNAGHYTQAEIDSSPEYYNNGTETVAFPLDQIHDLIDLRCAFSLRKFHAYISSGKFKNETTN